MRTCKYNPNPQMGITKKKKKRGGGREGKNVKCSNALFQCENVFFISNWMGSFKASLPSKWNKQNSFIFSFYQKRKNQFLNCAAQTFLFNFFSPFSLATIANNFIICIALIAVIKQTQQMLTLHRASVATPQPTQSVFCQWKGRSERLCAEVKRNYRLLFYLFFF